MYNATQLRVTDRTGTGTIYHLDPLLALHNARQFKHRDLRGYPEARKRAMKPVASKLRQADMLAWAARCVTMMERIKGNFA